MPASYALLEAALERDLPTLAICRGFQLLNVLRGGDLIQHLPEHVGHEGHRETLGVFSQHPVEVKEGTRLEAILGPRHGAVNSSHHQGVGRVGEGLVESAFAEDGSLEAIEDPSKRFALGVLWHPEMEDGRQAALRGARRGSARLPRRPLSYPSRAQDHRPRVEVDGWEARLRSFPLGVNEPLDRRMHSPRRGIECGAVGLAGACGTPAGPRTERRRGAAARHNREGVDRFHERGRGAPLDVCEA